ncbi:MAG: F-type H+-transporting ATPase subunit b [Candidatus Saccharimonadales bacterium]|jgi:F-type H+-transporting ATPase subunit b
MIQTLHTFAAVTEAVEEGAQVAAETSEGIGALGLSLPAIGASALTFLVLFFIIKKFALEGIVANLQKRETDISRGLHLTAELDKQKAELDERVEKILQAARKDADMILAEARTETGSIIKAAEDSANNRASEIMRAAEGKIEREIAEARAGLKGEMSDLIVEATESILSQKLDAKEDRKLVEKYLTEAMK